MPFKKTEGYTAARINKQNCDPSSLSNLMKTQEVLLQGNTKLENNPVHELYTQRISIQPPIRHKMAL